MNYTVIQKTGWQGDGWKVAETFSKKNKAEEFVSLNASANARNDFYRTRIMSHRKPLAKLTNWDHGFGAVTFSDGTKALR